MTAWQIHGSAPMRQRLIFVSLLFVPAAAAVAVAPVAAADPPICTANQIAQYDNCVPAPPPSGGCSSIMCMPAIGAQDVYLPATPPLGTPAGGGPVAVGAQDVYGTGTPPLDTPPPVGSPPSNCGGIMCLVPNGAQDAYTP